MLVLSRKSGESLQIDASIQISVLSVSKGRVKLGITAPEHMRILRQELICSEQGEALMHGETWSQHAIGEPVLS